MSGCAQRATGALSVRRIGSDAIFVSISFGAGELEPGLEVCRRFARRRLCATLPEAPDGDAENPRLVGEILADARTGEDDDADGQDVE